jgi:urease accessory protein
MNALEPTLALLQLSDSLFPSGAFVHSYSLEQAARDHLVRTPAELEGFIASILGEVLASADAPTTCRAHRAASAGNFEALLEADRALLRTKAAEELRAASLSIGRRQLEEVSAYIESDVLARYREAIQKDRTLGTHPAVFAAICAAIGVEVETAVASLLLGAVNGMLQASMRLLPVSHRDVQATLHRLRPEIAEIARDVTASLPHPLRSFHPAQEIASMRHAGASARLFAS